MNTTVKIANKLGRQEIASRIGVTKQMVYNRTSEGKYPAKWYAIILSMCAERGMEAPDIEAFSFDLPKPKLGVEG